MTPLFPPYLSKGSKDVDGRGPVTWLQRLLIAMGAKFLPNGTYDDETASWVSKLQVQYGAANTNGDFGLEIRKLLATKRGIDVALILVPLSVQGPVVFYSEKPWHDLHPWPPLPEEVPEKSKVTLLHK